MMKESLLALAAALPLVATELPPVVAAGPVHYDDISYQDATPAPEAPAYTDSTYTAAAPETPAPSDGSNGEIIINAFSTNYQVRGMGVTNGLSEYGSSSVGASYTLPNRNLFNYGLHQRVSGTFGLIWGGEGELGDTPMLNLNYALGKEVLPNLLVEAGYSIHHGGLEGYMARATGCSHRIAQDFNLAIRFDDKQQGFFGHILWGVGFQGLTGSFFDVCGGYRFTDVASHGNYGADLELSAGVATSIGYWGGGVEGIDAYRLRAALRPYSHNGTFGRDARWQLTPWAQLSWAGDNAGKIDRAIGSGPIDHFQFTIGLDLSYRF